MKPDKKSINAAINSRVDKIINPIKSEEQKALDWWDKLSDSNKYIISNGKSDDFHLSANSILNHYNWIKSITPKD